LFLEFIHLPPFAQQCDRSRGTFCENPDHFLEGGVLKWY
jgi:hypothetical protein